MPATRELSWTHTDIEGSVDAHINLLDREEVYFTDQEPRFEIIIENNTAFDVNHSTVAWVIAIGQGRPEPFIRDHISDISISAGDQYAIEISKEPLSLEGHAIIALGSGIIRQVDEENNSIKFKASKSKKEQYEPLTTFSVWDREHYEVVHEQPQRTQQFALFASFGIVFFAVVQLGTVLGYPIIGLLGGFGILGIYWYSGFLSELIETLLDHHEV